MENNSYNMAEWRVQLKRGSENKPKQGEVQEDGQLIHIAKEETLLQLSEAHFKECKYEERGAEDCSCMEKLWRGACARRRLQGWSVDFQKFNDLGSKERYRCHEIRFNFVRTVCHS